MSRKTSGLKRIANLALCICLCCFFIFESVLANEVSPDADNFRTILADSDDSIQEPADPEGVFGDDEGLKSDDNDIVFDVVNEDTISYDSDAIDSNADETVFNDTNDSTPPAEDISGSSKEENDYTDAVYAANPQASYTLKVSGSFFYNKVQDCLKEVNALRESLGIDKLVMDPHLTDLAMQRAAETAVFWDHIRPDGSYCFTIDDRIFAENIVFGSKSGSSAFQYWANSPGHYSNMVNKGYKSIGIGYFQCGNMNCWVQVFSPDNATSTDTRSYTQVNTPSVSIVEQDSPLYLNMDLVTPGDSLTLFVESGGFQLKPGRLNRGIYGNDGGQSELERMHFLDSICEFTPDSFSWSSSNESVAYVSQTGYLIPISVGETVITAKTINGNGSTELKVRICNNIKSAELELSKNEVTYTGKEQKVGVTLKAGDRVLSEGTDYILSYEDNLNAGTATIRINGTGSYAGSRTATFTIAPRNIINNLRFQIASYDATGYSSEHDFLSANVKVFYNTKELIYHDDYWFSLVGINKDNSLRYFRISLKGNYTGEHYVRSLDEGFIRGLNDVVYTGKKIVPKLEVFENAWSAYSNSELMLTEGKDYTYSIKNNLNAGTATITVKGMIPKTGKGFYFGSFQQTFNIRPASLTKATLQFSSAQYTGRKITPTVTVKATVDGKTVTLKKGRDFTVKYEKNIEVGKATVKITGKGNYTGTILKNFKIIPKSVSLRSAQQKGKNSLVLRWKKAPASTSGYIIQYSTDKNFSSKYTKKIDDNSITSRTITGLKKNKKYYFRIRTYQMLYRTRYLSPWSSVMSAMID